MALSDQEFNRLKNLIGERQQPNLSGFSGSTPSTGGGIVKGMQDFSEGFVKGGLQSAIGTARTLQTAGQGVLAAIDPTKTFADIRQETGFKSLQGEQAQQIDEILKSENTAEKAGKLTAFLSEILIPTGGAKKGVELAEAGLGKTRQGIEATQELIGKGTETAKDVLGGASELIKSTVQGAKQIPSRVKTNVQEIKKTEQEIAKLPQTVQNVVRQGVDIEDAKDIVNVSPKAKPAIQKLWNQTKSFLENKTKINPVSAVGKPVVQRLNSLKKETEVLTNKLTKVAENLKGQSVKGLDRLYGVVDNGLDNFNIKVTDKGLDFADADIVGGEKLISNVYSRLQRAKDANDLHRLKRFIDSNVEFGKRAEGLTGSAERLLKGWRKNIDNLLDKQFKDYNKVNTELSKKINPLNDLRKYLKTAEDKFDEDLLELDAGMLMQRIASNVRSNPALRQTLRNLDKASNVKGSLSGEIDSLVDFYAKLQDYFPEIVNKQSLRGQVTRGIQDVKGFAGKITEEVAKVAGQTDAVRRKAFTDLLDEMLK